MSPGFFGWKVIAALWLIIFVNLAFTSYGAGVIGAFMLEDLQIGRSLLGLGFTVFILAQGLSAPLAAWVVNRAGTRMTITYGSLFLALTAFVLAHFTTAGWNYVVGFGVGVGVAVGFSSSMPAQTCVTMWFMKRRGLAIALVMSAAGVGGFAAAPLLNHVIVMTGGNWRSGWYLISACALLSAAIAYLFVRNSPAELGQVPDGIAETDERRSADSQRAPARKVVYRSSVPWSVAAALRTRTMWLITLAAIGFSMPLTVFLAHGVPHLMDLGHAPAAAALAIGTLAIFSTVGKLGGGFLCDRLEPRYVWCVSLIMTAAGIALSTSALSQPEVYAFALLLGTGYGASLVCWPAMVANYFGASSFASMMGVQFPMNTLVSSMSPLIVGLLFDQFGSYRLSFFGIGALAVAFGILLLLATPPRLASTAPADLARSVP